ncbi:hypothetical protein [Rhizobium sp. RU36D]|uniref:hypothetical protein n=1 Tax=Rhizobium sp. RU36D TaxID=1907415 RepID=UPI0009D8F710|nr:hypothetical protein [Rhizobium sp. RU36D]SMC96827.1 hypothetical protein SAMN05880593_112108 [Rhizobium sp. RU36D]
MAFWLLITWLVPAFVLLALTYAEGASVGRRDWDFWRFAGLAGCLAWPLALPLLVIVSRRHSRVTAEAARTRIATSMNDNVVVLLLATITALVTVVPFAWALKIF